LQFSSELVSAEQAKSRALVQSPFTPTSDTKP
jgi:hypothetical protein